MARGGESGVPTGRPSQLSPLIGAAKVGSHEFFARTGRERQPASSVCWPWRHTSEQNVHSESELLKGDYTTKYLIPAHVLDRLNQPSRYLRPRTSCDLRTSANLLYTRRAQKMTPAWAMKRPIISTTNPTIHAQTSASGEPYFRTSPRCVTIS
jgi:hypothetical protein